MNLLNNLYEKLRRMKSSLEKFYFVCLSNNFHEMLVTIRVVLKFRRYVNEN